MSAKPTDPFPDKRRKNLYTEAFLQGNEDFRKGREYKQPLHAEQIQEDGYWAGWTSAGGPSPKLNALTP